jgi:hypothetical protein
VANCRRYQRHRQQICHQYQPAANFSTSSSCVVDNGGKFATGVNVTGGKFAAGFNDAGGKLQPVSTTPAAKKVNLKAKIYMYISYTTQR